VHRTSDIGVYLTGTGRATVEDHEITETAGDGTLVADGADTLVLRTTFTLSAGMPSTRRSS
jgi:hypothetical protein